MLHLPNLDLATRIDFVAGSAVIHFRGGESLTLEGELARQVASRVGAPVQALDAPQSPEPAEAGVAADEISATEPAPSAPAVPLPADPDPAEPSALPPQPERSATGRGPAAGRQFGGMLIDLPQAGIAVNLEHAIRIDLPPTGDVAVIVMGLPPSHSRRLGLTRQYPPPIRIDGDEDIRRIRAAVDAPLES